MSDQIKECLFEGVNMSEYLFGFVWAVLTVVIIVCGLSLDFQPDYFIGVVR